MTIETLFQRVKVGDTIVYGYTYPTATQVSSRVTRKTTTQIVLKNGEKINKYGRVIGSRQRGIGYKEILYINNVEV
jgi:hypothetical protein